MVAHTSPSRSWLRRGRNAATRVALKLATVTIGALYVSPPAQWLRRSVGNQKLPPDPRSAPRTALVAHVFYPDLIPEILECFSRFPPDSSLIATAVEDGVEIVVRALSSVPNARVIPVSNRGRDIAPFLQLLHDGILDEFDAVLKLHTKRSPHLIDGTIRRKLLFSELAGSRRRVSHVLSLLETATIGLVGWRMSWHHTPPFWMGNQARVGVLCRLMGFHPPQAPAFFEGSMFWTRPAALRRLRELAFKSTDFEPEAGQIDGALHHAIERVFALAAAADNYTVRDLAGRLLYPPKLPADSKTTLAQPL